MFRTTVKSLLARKRRLVTTGVAVLLGVAFMSGTFVLTDTLNRTFEDLFGDVYADIDAHVRSTSAVENAFGEAERPLFDAEVVEQVAAVEGVDAAEGYVEGYAQLVGPDGELVGDPASGAPTFGANWSDDDRINPFTLDEGEAPDEEGEVVIDRASAETSGYGAGDTATVVTESGPVEVEVVGVATFGEVDSPGGASVVFFPSEQAQELLGEPGRFVGVDVVAEDGVSQEELRDRIAAVVPDDLEVLTGEEITEEQQTGIQEALGFFNTALLAFAGVALFVGAFIIYNTFSILVAQRTREMALLRAIGASRRQVLVSVLLEAVTVGVVASLVGLAVGVAVAAGLREAFAAFGIDLPTTGLVIAPRTVVVALVVGVVVTVLSAVVPARRAAGVPPVAAMREVAVDRTSRSVARAVVGTVLAAIGAAAIAFGLLGPSATALSAIGTGLALLFLGIAALGPIIARPVSRALGAPLPRLRGISGTLARENALRNPKRTANTASALMIGVALVGLITIMASSARATGEEYLDETFTGDFIVTSGAQFGGGGLPPELAEDLRELPEVGTATGARFGSASIEGESESRFVLGIDLEAATEVVGLEVVEGSLDDLDTSSVAVAEDLATSEGLEVGDTVTATFAQTGEQTLTVDVVVDGTDLVGGQYLLDLPAFEANVGDAPDAQVFVGLAEGASGEEARPAIEELAAAYPNAEVQDLTDLKEEQRASINQLLSLVYVLLALAIVIALVGIANTLALSILERTHELGLLRAVGMTRRQLRSTVLWESVLISLLGTLLGLAIALGFSYALFLALQDEGFTAFSPAAGQLAAITVLAGLAGVVAAIGPARRAARLDVLRAIATE